MIVSATNGKTTTAGHDRRRAAGRRTRAGPQPRRLEHDLGRRHRAARAARRRGPVRGRRGVAAAGRGGARPAPDRARQPVPRPARPLRRARAPRRRVGRAGGRARRARPGSCSERRRPAGRRPRPRPRARAAARASPTSGSRTRARRCRSSSTPSTPSTAAAAALPTRTSGPSSAIWATTVPELRRRPAAARRRRDRIELDGMRGSRVAVRTPAGEVELEPPPPGLYNVYNALAALAAALRARRSGSRTRGRRSGRCEAVFGRVETIDGRRRRAVSILLIKNPAGANEVLRTLLLEARRGPAPASISGSRSTTESPTAATSPGSGTPTSSCSPVSVRAGRLRGDAGRRRWRCG